MSGATSILAHTVTHSSAAEMPAGCCSMHRAQATQGCAETDQLCRLTYVLYTNQQEAHQRRDCNSQPETAQEHGQH